MKFVKQKITIIFSLLLAIIPFSFAENSTIKEQEGYYWIEVILEPSPRAIEYRTATLRAKSQLARYLKADKPIVTLDVRHFILEKRERKDNVSIYRFKVAKENVKKAK